MSRCVEERGGVSFKRFRHGFAFEVERRGDEARFPLVRIFPTALWVLSYRRWSNVVVPGWRKVRNYPRWNYPVRPRITRYVGGPGGPEPALGERADPAPNLRIVVRSSQQTPLRRHGRLGVSMHGIMPVVDTGSPGPSHIRLCQCRHGPDFQVHAGAAAARRAWERTHFVVGTSTYLNSQDY